MKIGTAGLEQEIPTPQAPLVITPFEIKRNIRTASGKLKKNVIAIKHKYQLSYKGLSPATLKIFADIYKAGQAVNFIYDDSDGEKTVVVYIIPPSRDVPKYHPELSQNVSIELEEV